MPILRTEAAKDSLLRRVRRQRLKYITVLPSLITILNGVCGFAALVFAANGAGVEINHFSYHKLQVPYFAMSGYMIMFAMIADMLDGRLARMSKSTSSFGGQLDSLCDIVSFGVAPAFLMLKVLEYKLTNLSELNPTFESLLGRFIWLAAAAYISCAAIRLARFNVENEEDESAHMSFVGLPTPAAAGVIGSLIIFHQETLPELSARSAGAYIICENIVMYALPFLAISMAVLMVSRIRYPHILNQYIKGKKPFAHLIRVLVFLGLIIWSRQAVLVLIFCGFAASGFVKWFYYKILRKDRLALSIEQEILMGVDETQAAEQEKNI
jgi:CDP-diacylglycerol--serine O-phosphatidyltransferase